MPEPIPPWKTIAAYAVLYLVWGSTFLAIRIGVAEVPPFLFAAMRFFTAGLLLFAYALARRERLPTRLQWLSATALAVLISVLNHGLLFWAEQRVPSGVASVMLATIPAFMALSEILILGTQRLTLRLAVALLIGLAGVAALTTRSLSLAGQPIDPRGAVALLIGAISWSIASSLTRKLPLPASKTVSSAAQMLTGGLLLTLLSASLGEFHRFHPAQVSRAAWIALAYLIFAGSILAFTTYLWLIHHQTPTRVGTYAFVNPVVAVLLGFFFAHEPLTARTLLGAACVLTAVLVLLTTRKPAPSRTTPQPSEAA